MDGWASSQLAVVGVHVEVALAAMADRGRQLLDPALHELHVLARRSAGQRTGKRSRGMR